MALPAISRDRSTPRFSQDSAAAPVQFSPEGARQYNEWRAANPEKAAWLDKQWGFNWKDLLVLGIPVAGAVAAAALAGGGAAAAGGAAATGGTGIGTGTATGLGSGVGLGLPGAGASLPISGGGAGLLAGTPGVSAASLFGAAATPAAGFAPAATSALLGNTPGVSGSALGGAPFNWGALGRSLLGLPNRGGGQQGGTIPAIANLIGRSASAIQGGRAQGRLEEADAARLYDSLNLARTRTQYDRAARELDQREFAQDLQERSFGNATRASFLQNYTAPPSSLPPEMQQFSGPRAAGLESIPQAQRDEYAGAMYRNAVQELLDPLQPGTAATGRRMAALPEPDPLSPTPSATGFDTTLDWIGRIGGLFGPQAPPTTTPRTPQTGTTAPGPTGTTPSTPTGPQSSTPTRPRPQPFDPITGRPYTFGDVPSSIPDSTRTSTSLGEAAGLPPIASLVGPVPGPNVGSLAPYEDPLDAWRRRGRA